jgi:hypothetical protein
MRRNSATERKVSSIAETSSATACDDSFAITIRCSMSTKMPPMYAQREEYLGSGVDNVPAAAVTHLPSAECLREFSVRPSVSVPVFHNVIYPCCWSDRSRVRLRVLTKGANARTGWAAANWFCSEIICACCALTCACRASTSAGSSGMPPPRAYASAGRTPETLKFPMERFSRRLKAPF